MVSRRMPCELVVFELLPTARGAIAKELVEAQEATYVAIAVSQYVKGLRGGNPYIDASVHRDEFYQHIREIAANLHNGADLIEELCCLCKFFKESGMIEEIYAKQGATMPLSKCMECPRKNI